jgi:predicted molibdopterin-dependent oxidoreductase YjgC
MSNPAPIFRPFDKLIKISIAGREFQVPEGNMLLRAFQYLCEEDVAHGRFCWNEECQDCRVHFDLGPDTPNRVAISCKLMVREGMRITDMAQEIRYCLRKLELK